MSGRGGVDQQKHWDGIVPPECSSNPSILNLDPSLTWVEAQEPLHKGIDGEATIGPGMSFANLVLAKKPGLGVLGLVPCAMGGTKISEWARGTFLYNRMVTRAQAAVRGGGMIRAILWFQGESDAITAEDANNYKQRLEQFIQNVRSDLGSPTLPFIQVGIATGLGPYKDAVRTAQFGVNLPNVKIVDAQGLPIMWDYTHITTQGQVQLGHMLADTYLRNF
ncbi:Sialate O-acetylesterase domain [Dillenia turbinata]|uniref:Sialate O-acetylesterase domain n=1 Tax=Dillenia turbinata TaxID=194707 RepID=A0AAN8VT27_9MAGN